MSSDSELTDEGKRKRGVQDTEVFAKSKRTMRSPQKNTIKNEDKLDKIMELLSSITKDIQEIKQKQKQYQSDIIDIKRGYEKMKDINEKLLKENIQIRKELDDYKHVAEQMEKETKKCNVVISGLVNKESEEKSITNRVQEILVTQLEIDVTINKAFSLSANACLVQLKNIEDKELVMRNKHKLRNMKGNTKIYINEDLTKHERMKQAEIRKVAKSMMEEGKKIKIGYNKITADGEVWRWNKSKNKLEKPKN